MDPSLIQLHHQDIYVDSTVLAKWLPIDVAISVHDALINITPREPLPLQQRLARERRLAQPPGYLPAPDPGYPRVPNPYRPASAPFIDQSLSLTTNAGSAGPGFGINYAALLTGDIGYLNGSMSLSWDQDQARPAVRLTLNRIDPDARLLGPWRAAEISLLHTFSPDVPLIASSGSGEGVRISNYPLFQQTQFGTHTFTGDLPPDWEVELYRDETLLAYQRDQGNGRYEFRDVPLLFGDNNFRLVFYGPHNEKREEAYPFEVGNTLVPAGAQYYQLAFTDLDDGGAGFTYQQQFGLQRDLTLDLFAASQALPEGTRQYAGAGLQGFRHGIFAYGDLALARDGGRGEEIGLQTRLGAASVFLQQTWLDGLDSALFPETGDPLRARTTLRLDGIPNPLMMQPMSLSARRDRYASGAVTTVASNRLSWQAGLWRFSQYLNWSAEERADAANRSLTGEWLASRYYRRLALHGNLNYTLYPHGKLQALDLSIDAPLHGAMLTAGAAQSLTDHRLGIHASYRRLTGSVAVGLSVAFSGPNTFSAGLTFSSSLVRNTPAERWESSARALANQGAVQVHAFLDRNRNGALDPDEMPVKGAGFFINRAAGDVYTDAHGHALITGLRAYQPADLSLSAGTLDDPLWVSRLPGVRVIPRPGVVLHVDFPIDANGEISGTVAVRTEQDRRAVAGMLVELVEASGAVAQTVRSEYDGFFTLTKVPAGDYTLRMALTQPAARRYLPCAIPVTIPDAGAFLDGADLLLTPADAPPAG